MAEELWVEGRGDVAGPLKCGVMTLDSASSRDVAISFCMGYHALRHTFWTALPGKSTVPF